jgi:GNAT superfamily N-acetyltransferase
MPPHSLALADGLYPVPPGKLAAIVTHFERFTPPLGPPPALPEGCLCRLQPTPDPGWYRTLYRAVGDPWLWFSRLEFDDAGLAALLADPAREVLALSLHGRDIGLVELDRRTPGQVEIVYFGLVPDAAGRGLGRALMEQALAQAFAPGVRRVWLHTCTHDDPRAPGFYARMGFAAFAQEIELVDDPRDLGLLPDAVGPQHVRVPFTRAG